MSEPTNPIATILSALNRAMQAVSYVQKTGRNAFHGYTYASEADLLEAIRPALVKEGLFLMPSVESTTGPDEHGTTHVVVSYTLAHVSGAVWPEKIRSVGAGNDKARNGQIGDKGVYKALTGASKYAIKNLMMIATGDDAEQEPAQPPAQAQAQAPKQAKPDHAADLLAVLPKLTQRQLLVNWVRDLDRLVHESQRPRLRTAFLEHCSQLKLDAREVSLAAKENKS